MFESPSFPFDILEKFSITFAVLAPLSLALFTHLAVNWREPSPVSFLCLMISSITFISILLQDVYQISRASACSISFFFHFNYFFFLSISIIIYRLFFHRISSFDGPFWSKLTMWSWPITDFIGDRMYILQDYHQRLGAIVRIGPRELSISDFRAIREIYGTASTSQKISRGPFYSAQSMKAGVHSLLSEPIIRQHNQRRRDWDPAFSIKSLSEFEVVIKKVTAQLMDFFEQMAINGGENKDEFDIGRTMMWFGFDVMGELAFARSFGLVKAGKTSEAVQKLEEGVRMLNAFGNVPYMAQLASFFPSPIRSFDNWLHDALEWRLRKGKENKDGEEQQHNQRDVFTYLLGESHSRKRRLDRYELHLDCMLVVVAGSDTTSNAITLALAELSQKQHFIFKLREELKAVCKKHQVSSIEDISSTALRDNSPFLNAIIQETLRLWPPVPSGLQRTTLEPLVFTCENEKVMIPKNINISTHTFSIQRDEKNFVRPNEFIPERWMDSNKDGKEYFPHEELAFLPFSFGPTACIGKNLAMMEMREVLSQFILRFDIEISQKDYTRCIGSIKDHFTIAKGPLLAKLKLLERENFDF